MSVLSSTDNLLPKQLIAGFAAIVLMAGCSSDDKAAQDGSPPSDAVAEAAPDAGVDGNAGDLYPDLGAPPDFKVKEECESEWIDAVAAIDKVSIGVVSTEEISAGVYRTRIDGSAGGMQMAKNNPYVYVSLADGKAVAITDLESKKSTDWDIAFRRAVIRINGGDSGPGQGAVAILPGVDFDVAAPPAAGNAFAADEFIDEDCEVSHDPIENIRTAIGGMTGLWYDYDINNMKLTPLEQVYIIRRADGSMVKLEIESYYSMAGAGGHFSLRWAAL